MSLNNINNNKDNNYILQIKKMRINLYFKMEINKLEILILQTNHLLLFKNQINTLH